MTSVVIRLDPIFTLSDEQFLEVCRANPDVKFEQNSKGELIVVTPTGGDTGIYNAKLTTRFVVWNEQVSLGEVFDSSTCFELPNGAKRSPDVAWIQNSRWNSLTLEEKEKFPPIAPDFVLELLSPTDSLQETQAKMQEYIDNGVKLGWLLDRKARRVEIYRPGKEVEVLQDPDSLSGEDVLPGFVLNLQTIW
ncbi:MAG: Uma2 family endonuclease [Leptolyngbyaceae cyanobacterium HOT.MB2.61]|nr:Uma2 family endonuclease [Leptolyngbyaceae cyanobacterium HOT.MB2.61]